MSRFALEPLDTGPSRYKLFKLKNNTRCEYDDFRNDVEKSGTYDHELDIVDTVLLRVSNGEDVPPGRFKPLPLDGKDKIKDYEVRTKNLRVYLFQGPDGRIIVLGAIKTPKGQQQDIDRMRQIKNRFYEAYEKSQAATNNSSNNKKGKKSHTKGKRK